MSALLLLSAGEHCAWVSVDICWLGRCVIWGVTVELKLTLWWVQILRWRLTISVVACDTFAVVTTFVGGVSGSNAAYADGTGTRAGFNYPLGVALDASCNMFVVDAGNQRIRKVTPTGGTRITTLSVTMVVCFVGLDSHA